MSTRAYICIKNEAGDYRGVYCHFDGYLSGVGAVLFNYYQDINRVNQLIDLGDISAIGERLETPQVILRYGVDWRWNDEFKALNQAEQQQLIEDEEISTIAYAKAFGEAVKIAHWDTLEQLGDDLFESMICYVYLFKNGRWYYRDNSRANEFKPLTKRNIQE